MALSDLAGPWALVDAARPAPGVTRRAVALERVELAHVTLRPGADVADHAHAAEQIGTIVEGALHFRLDGSRRDLGPGDVYRVPGDTVHGGRAGPGGCVLIEAFSAPRDATALDTGTD